MSISNSLEDNRYDYRWQVQGELPEGINLTTSVRTISFLGTPTELGEFPFRLTVEATEKSFGTGINIGSEPDTLCDDTESRNMVLSVVQGF
ncbi:MAG: hypothetical protein AB8B87_24580 [Granulosicoccus sp.]